LLTDRAVSGVQSEQRVRAVKTAASVSFHALDAEQALQELTSDQDGLSPDEARRRLTQFGPNALRAAMPASAWKILLVSQRSPAP
jgi:Mg2+-importing ATPase